MKNKLNFFAWILTGLVLAASITAMFAAGKVNLDKFYDVGKICNVYSSSLQMQQSDVAYQDSDNYDFLCILNDNARIRYEIYKSSWNYMIIDIAYRNAENMTVSFLFYNTENQMVGSRREVLSSGENILEIYKGKFDYVVMQVQNQRGIEYRINKMQFRETLPDKTTEQFLLVFFGVFGLYCISSCGIIQFKKRINFRLRTNIAGGICNLYNRILKDNLLLFHRLSKRGRHIIRITAYILWFLYMVLSFNAGMLASGYQMNCIAGILLLLVLIGCSLEKKSDTIIRWDERYVKWSLLLIAWMCISDFVVSKRCGYMGYVFLIFYGLFFTSLNYSIRKWDILDDLVAAMHIIFVGSTIFCILSRPITTRYMGFYINTNVYATYLITMAVICMFELYRTLLGKGKRWRVAAIALELCCILYLWWLTQARGALIALVGVVVLEIVGIRKYLRNGETIWRIVLFFTTLCIIAIPVTETLGWMLENVPYRLDTVLQFENDSMPFVNQTIAGRWFVTDAYASTQRIKDTLQQGFSLDAISSGRITFWKAYLYQMNFFGHYFRETVYGAVHYAHNMFIAMMYRYGVLVLIPFAVYWLMTLKKGIILYRKDYNEYGILVLGLLMTYFIMAQLDVLEQPWAYPAWMFAYMMQGFLLEEKER